MLRAHDVMSTDVVTITGSATVAEAIARMQEHHVNALVVERRDDEDAYGLITRGDIVYNVVAYGKDPSAVYVHELMTKPCVTIHPDLGLEYVARLLAYLHVHHLPVARDRLIGMVSISDVFRHAL